MDKLMREIFPVQQNTNYCLKPRVEAGHTIIKTSSTSCVSLYYHGYVSIRTCAFHPQIHIHLDHMSHLYILIPSQGLGPQNLKYTHLAGLSHVDHMSPRIIKIKFKILLTNNLVLASSTHHRKTGIRCSIRHV
jgi:hypothetical protein